MRNFHTQNRTTVSRITNIGAEAINSTSYSVDVRESCPESCAGNQLIESTIASRAAVATTANAIICTRGLLRTAIAIAWVHRRGPECYGLSAMEGARSRAGRGQASTGH